MRFCGFFCFAKITEDTVIFFCEFVVNSRRPLALEVAFLHDSSFQSLGCNEVEVKLSQRNDSLINCLLKTSCGAKDLTAVEVVGAL